MAERYVQTFKDSMKKLTGGSIESRVARFLSCYRITPQSTTGTAPVELMFGRKIRTKLDLLKLDLAATVHKKQAVQKTAHDTHSVNRAFEEGTLVYVRNFNGSPKWLPGVIVKRTGPVSYLVQLENTQVHCHQDHIRIRTIVTVTSDSQLTSHQNSELNEDDMEDIIPILPRSESSVDIFCKHSKAIWLA